MRLFLLTLALHFCLMPSAFAHAGATDSHGGHFDRSTGEYHYHHGYPAHLHFNGLCPYNHDDKTGESSGFSSSSGVSTTWAPNVTKQPVSHKVVYTTAPPSTATPSPSFTERFVAHMFTLPIWVLPVISALTAFLLTLWWHHLSTQKLNEGHEAYVSRLISEHDSRTALLNEQHKQLLEAKSLSLKAMSQQYLELMNQHSSLLNQDSHLRTEENLRSFADLLQAEYTIAKEQGTLEDFYQAHSLRELSNMPDDTVIGSDILPKLRGSEHWGDKYTFYSSSFQGKHYHRSNCQYASIPFNAFTNPKCNIPCGICNPPPRPDTAWFDTYMKHRRECVRNGYTPKPNDVYHEHIDNTPSPNHTDIAF